MKLLRSNIPTPNMDDNVGRGIEMALTVGLMVGIGYGLDRWLGTTPIFMIVMTILAGVGFFAKFKYQYDARMDELEAERAELAGRTNVGGGGEGGARSD
jgi:Putative F0F1-ATPase subunit Ca2+/Mg2+ transporter